MLRHRIIPTLLISQGKLVKGMEFKNHKYVGDPINAVKIFNNKEIDELIFLDISCRKNNISISYDLIQDIADECLMPFGVGGGIDNIESDLLSSETLNNVNRDGDEYHQL